MNFASVVLLHAMVLCLLHGSVFASKIEFQATPSDVKAGLTDNLLIHCAITDTSTSAAIIGRRDVTSTSDNMADVSSLVIMKEGKDVASVGHNIPAHVMDGSANVLATGILTSGTGFLDLSIQNPTPAQIGEYLCESTAVSQTGHGVTFSTSIEVTTSAPTVADLIAYIRDMKQKYNQVVVFSAGLTKHVTVHQGHGLVYDKVFSNFGGGYNSSTGVFTCPTAGVYHFEVHAMSRNNLKFWLELQHNHQQVVTLYCDVADHENCSNSVNLQARPGDVVQVVATHQATETIAGFDPDIYNTFSGQLIAAL